MQIFTQTTWNTGNSPEDPPGTLDTVELYDADLFCFPELSYKELVLKDHIYRLHGMVLLSIEVSASFIIQNVRLCSKSFFWKFKPFGTEVLEKVFHKIM